MKFLLFVCLALPFATAFDKGGIVVSMLKLLPSNNSQCAREFFQLGKCTSSFEVLYKMLDSDEKYFNPGFMRKLVLATKEVSACLGEVTCEDAKFIKYILDGGSYIGERVYGDAFHCFIAIDVERTLEECQVKKLSIPAGHFPTKEDLKETTDGYYQCFREQLIAQPKACTPTRAVALFQAARALEDVYYTILATQKKRPVSYDFNPKLY